MDQQKFEEQFKKLESWIGESIQELRKTFGWKTADLAKRAEMNEAVLSEIEEGGKFTLAELSKILSGFGAVSLEQFFDYVGRIRAVKETATKIPA